MSSGREKYPDRLGGKKKIWIRLMIERRLLLGASVFDACVIVAVIFLRSAYKCGEHPGVGLCRFRRVGEESAGNAFLSL